MGFGGDNIFGSNLSLGQFGYMAEAEGQDDLVDTTDAKMNAAIAQMKAELGWASGMDDMDMTYEVNSILSQHGLDPDNLTTAQLRKIRRAIA